MSTLKDFVELATGFGLGVAVVLSLVVAILKNPLLVFKAWSSLARVLHKLFGWWSKAAIASEIEVHINNGIQQLGREVPGAFDKAVRLKWLSTGEDYAALEDGAVVVRVKDDPDMRKPLVAATLLYLQEGVIPESRPYIERRILRAMDLVLAHRILVNCPRRDVVGHLTRDYVEPSIEDQRVAQYYESADLIDRVGLLTRVVLREMSGFAARLVGKRPSSAIRKESLHFFEFVGRFANRTSEIPLRFFGRFIKCTVALIAEEATYKRSGLAVYQHNFERDINLGVHVIYLLSRGYENIQVGRHVAKWAADNELISGSLPDRFLQPGETGEAVPAECVVCFSSRVGRSVKIGPLEEAQITVSQAIPESLTGEIEVVSIAREHGRVTKVLVRSDVYDDPVAVCRGSNDERVQLIVDELGTDEIIDFIRWDPELRKNVVAALVPLQEEDVISVRIAPNRYLARVTVRGAAAANRAVGTDGVNLKVAQRLLGVNIDLDRREAVLGPDEELLDILAYMVPEIDEGKIEVVRVARRVGRAAKIAVRSDEISNVRKVCAGPRGRTVKALSKHLGGEHITFVVWNPEQLERCVREALYPLRGNMIVSISLDADEGRAIVKVRDGEARAIGVGRDGVNVRLAEEVCELQIEIRERT